MSAGRAPATTLQPAVREESALLRFHNTLSRRVEDFVPLESGRVTIYSCGPTVYRDVHIGNLRTYLMADWLRRVLRRQGLAVTHVKNITDVGHMRSDMLERGEDKVIAAARAAGRTTEQIAEQYTRSFLDAERQLNILPADVFCKATEHIPQMRALIERLEQRGLAYTVSGNVYFSVSAFPDYGKLSGNIGDGLEEGVRVEADPLKRDPRDFALWKAAEPGREMSWPSNWGEGFPGWHIECSAMSMRHLGERFDFHTGGVDNIFPHHEDEIAQSEGASGHPVVRTWMHGEHLLVDGVKMAKSTGNSFTIEDVRARGYDPLALRYLCLTAHYRHRLNFTWHSLRAAAAGLNRLRVEASRLGRETSKASEKTAGWEARFDAQVGDDLALPSALATLWAMLRSDLAPQHKAHLLRAYDEVLGLALCEQAQTPPHEVATIAQRRADLRVHATYGDADSLRSQLETAGWQVRDTRGGFDLVPLLRLPAPPPTVNSSSEVPSFLAKPAALDFSVVVVSRDDLSAVRRSIESILRYAPPATEVLVVDNGSPPDAAAAVEAFARSHDRVRVVLTDHNIGAAGARNIGARLATGSIVVFVDTSVEFTGDALSPLRAALAADDAGIVGRWGVNTNDLREFTDAPGPDVDAVEGYVMAIKRERLAEIGLFDEKYRFYRHLDLDASFAVRARGYRNLIIADLPMTRHEHTEWNRLPPEERDRLSKRNYYRFLHKYRDAEHLLLAHAAR